MDSLNAMAQLEMDHTARQIQRMKTRAPIILVSVVIGLGSIGLGVFLGSGGHMVAAVATALVGVVVAVLWSLSAQLLAEWDRAVVLRLGHFRNVCGPGFFTLVPILDTVTRVVDMRVRTTTFHSESMLTKDTVPVSVDAIAFWHVWDARKAILEVESYYQAMVLAIQTALRDIVGVHSLAEILAEREMISETLQKVLAEKTEAWGMSVNAIETRDIAIPANLRDALSKQAQAERERQARGILGQAEIDIAEKFSEAAKSYENNPVALHLRAMNIIYEGLRAGGSLMLVPASVLDTMNLGTMAALGEQVRPLKPDAAPGDREGTDSHTPC